METENITKSFIRNKHYIACIIDDCGGEPYYISNSVVRFRVGKVLGAYFLKCKKLEINRVDYGYGIDAIKKWVNIIKNE